jgi:hypothetical protein
MIELPVQLMEMREWEPIWMKGSTTGVAFRLGLASLYCE